MPIAYTSKRRCRATIDNRIVSGTSGSVAQERSAHHGAIRRKNDRRLSSVSIRYRSVCCRTWQLRWQLPIFPDELGEAELLVDDVSLRLGHQRKPGSHTRATDPPRILRFATRRRRAVVVGSRTICNRSRLVAGSGSLDGAIAVGSGSSSIWGQTGTARDTVGATRRDTRCIRKAGTIRGDRSFRFRICTTIATDNERRNGHRHATRTSVLPSRPRNCVEIGVGSSLRSFENFSPLGASKRDVTGGLFRAARASIR